MIGPLAESEYTTALDNYQSGLYTRGMRKENRIELARIIRRAIESDPRSLYEIARTADVAYQSLHPFARGQRDDIALSTADRLCKVLGLTLRPARQRKGR